MADTPDTPARAVMEALREQQRQEQQRLTFRPDRWADYWEPMPWC